MNENQLDNPNLMDVLPILREEYDKAEAKHPTFPWIPVEMANVMMEELGEFSKEINDVKEGWIDRAIIEAAHVAVTALRAAKAMKELKEETNE